MSKRFKPSPVKPEMGVWSGRGIGIPVVGAIGGGDDYKQKIGRDKIRWDQTGFKGSPSLSADATYSVYLARVNKDWDEEYEAVMFPSQEEDDVNIYDMDVSAIRSRKTPRDFKVKHPRALGISERHVFDENDVVENSRYRLTQVTEGIFTQIFGDIAGDIGAAALAAVPLFGVPAAAGLAGWNIKQLKDDMDNSDVAITAFLKSPSDDTVEMMNDELDSITVNLIDLFQRLLELVPDAEWPIGEAASVMTSIVNNLVKLKRALQVTGLATPKFTHMPIGGIGPTGPATSLATKTAAKAKVAGIITPILKFFMGILDSGAAPRVFRDNKGVILGVPRRMILLADLIDDYHIQEDAAAAVGQEFVYQNRIIPEGGYNSYDYVRSPIRSGQQAPQQQAFRVEDLTFSDPAAAVAHIQRQQQQGQQLSLEERTMRKDMKNLRKFIRETVKTALRETSYPDYPSMHPPNPTGYQFRNVPVIEPESQQVDKFETLDSYDDFSVSYTADGGVVNYQARNKLKLDEERHLALRRLIRQDIAGIVKESKKK